MVFLVKKIYEYIVIKGDILEVKMRLTSLIISSRKYAESKVQGASETKSMVFISVTENCIC